MALHVILINTAACYTHTLIAELQLVSTCSESPPILTRAICKNVL